MFRKRKLVRIIALFFTLELMLDIAMPYVSYALTSGPTAPEATSFEPVDTTDMVNLATGDFNYNMPLFEVPGPAGGYPLSLSYHAGIKNDQEASWVGLGWTLNPGAINRSVSGFPDDSKDDISRVNDYSDGGERDATTYNLSLSQTLNNFLSTSVNLTYSTSRDTYEGFSHAFSVGRSTGIGIQGKSAKKIGASPGIRLSESSSLSFSDENGFGLNQTFLAGFGTLSHSFASGSLGISLNSKGKIKASAAVSANAINSTAGRLTQKNETRTVFALPGMVDIQKHHTRYWSDESSFIHQYGALYPSNANQRIGEDYYDAELDPSVWPVQLQNYSYDVHHLYDEESTDDLETTTDRQLGGSFPNYDDYQVLGQGVGGSITPHIIENGDLNGQNAYDLFLFNGAPIISSPRLGHKSARKHNIGKVNFRFKNDYSNNQEITPASVNFDGTDFSAAEHGVSFSDPSGAIYSSTTQKLAGSQHVEWFSNQEIANGTANGLMDYYANPSERRLEYIIQEDYLQPEVFLRNSHLSDKYTNDIGNSGLSGVDPVTYDLSHKIGGFKVTNSSGVTYHYSLPVYSHSEYTRIRKKETRENVPEHREIKNPAPYAHTWLLTGVTGPDFVDRGGAGGVPNGVFDEEDWGYWVKFDYGLWSDSFQWRTPSTGYRHDISADVMTFNYGIKEIYYLDAVETKSHVAIFSKTIRRDGKGVTSRLEGGFKPRHYEMEYLGEGDAGQPSVQLGEFHFNVSPVSTMQLDQIYLLDREDFERLNLSKSTGNKYNEGSITNPHVYNYSGVPIRFSLIGNPPYEDASDPEMDASSTIEVKYHNGDLVYDKYDFEDILEETNGLKESSIRIIDFEYDNSLANGTDNSYSFLFDYALDDFNDCPFQLLFDETSIMPNNSQSGCFIIRDDCGIPAKGNGELYHINAMSNVKSNCGDATGSALNPEGLTVFGNRITYPKSGKLTLTSLNIFGKGGTSIIPPHEFAYNNPNPDYDLQKYDDWGYYKNDYGTGSNTPLYITPTRNADGQIITGELDARTRQTTEASSNETDAWSLSEVKLPLGSTLSVEYESNQFQSVLNNDTRFEIESVTRSSGNVKLTFKKKEIDLPHFFVPGGTLKLEALLVDQMTAVPPADEENVRAHEVEDNDCSIVSVGTDHIIVQNTELYDLILSTAYTENVSGTLYSVLPKFISGQAISKVQEHKGAGIRVRKVITSDALTGRQNWQAYDYNDPSTGVTSGRTPYQPYDQITTAYSIHDDFFYDLLRSEEVSVISKMNNMIASFQRKLNNYDEKIISLITDIPPPGVLYEYVLVSSGVDENAYPQKEQYHFQVFKENMITKDHSVSINGSTKSKTIRIVNNTAGVGNLLSRKILSESDNLIFEQSNNYLSDDNNLPYEADLLATGQGKIDQSAHRAFSYIKAYVHDYDDPTGYTLIASGDNSVVTHRTTLSDVLTQTTETDYKTGVRSTTSFRQFDFFSGEALKTVSDDSYGNWLVTERTPAYHHYPPMGLAINGGTNMLIQEGSEMVFQADNESALSPTGLISATVQTWSDEVTALDAIAAEQSGIWRKHSSYIYLGNDITLTADDQYLYPFSSFTNNSFNAWGHGQEPTSEQWQKNSEITLYDVHSHALEVVDVNGNYAATRMDKQQERVVATVANAAYSEFRAFTFEDESPNEPGPVDELFSMSIGEVTGAARHTGNYSIRDSGFGDNAWKFNIPLGSDLLSPGTYRISAWVRADDISEVRIAENYCNAGSSQTAYYPVDVAKSSGDWYLVNREFTYTGGCAVRIEGYNDGSGTIYWDDIRLHPINATMTSYVYNEWGELEYILDVNNIYTKYEYNAMGQLKAVWRETFTNDNDGASDGKVQLSSTRIHYKRSSDD
ncbi:MAG: hypothetical protein AAF149_13245 [Bacteroidota bacterium]